MGRKVNHFRHRHLRAPNTSCFTLYIMETLIQITGLQYACEGTDVATLMAELEEQRPEVLLVKEQTNDFGIVVRALTGTRSCGVVSRFDLEQTLGMMQHDNTPVLVGRVAETNSEGRCFSISVCGDYPTPDSSAANNNSLWDNWQWTGAPLMDSSPEERRLDISLKIASAELQQHRGVNRQTLLEHLNIILQLTNWDISSETQQQLGTIRRLVGRHPDSEVRALAPLLRHSLNALGSRQRGTEFRDIYLPQLCKSTEAEHMNNLWCQANVGHLGKPELWKPTIIRQLETIEANLRLLPAGLYYQTERFDMLMHRLLYIGIPRRKLVMLLSAIVLRQLLRQQIGLQTGTTDNAAEERELQLAQQLAPTFYGNTTKALNFLMLVKGKKPSDITRLVSQWVADKHIRADLCHRPLWTILHEADIYTATESNWNAMLNIRKRTY